MKYTFLIFICLFINSIFAQLPKGFVYVENIIPDLEVELRYFTSNNFVGEPIEGYHANKLILTKESAEALKLVHEDLQEQNLCLKVYDGYRPQRAVNHFINWAKDLNDTINKAVFYPNVKKRNLFKEEYIASRSGHSRGSTLDLTIIDANTGVILDMGSIYDFFGEESWVNYDNLTDQQKKNRQLLQFYMNKYGFRNYPKEWWHFTLRGEPFPNTYFDFPVN
ncbi:M15 family metallopeptidase [Algibacter luteus]|uniref:D-alanyl-D-alanine dipeptidase n=1 Tax=Algibacter luteus TaxID=1178825 RepID=A0A1M6CJ89_9FLAO|nr:M15 family metallopeptidase [Algibacter luteus]SHI60814.1 D-Ala-D-Ala dipeptidase vanX. Metallo peptidase. MEROPS family M15D [Algibacter luteus]